MRWPQGTQATGTPADPVIGQPVLVFPYSSHYNLSVFFDRAAQSKHSFLSVHSRRLRSPGLGVVETEPKAQASVGEGLHCPGGETHEVDDDNDGS